ncbi:MAG: hypothetical protein Q7K40_01435 [bacterium]|nr:hypothetical protein [bacterium]
MENYLEILIGYLMNLELWSAFFGLVGTMILFFFGLPPRVNPEGDSCLLLEQTDETEKRKYERYKKLSYFGLLLIAFSFLIQIILII